jgi:ribosome biogenesis GTPase A
MKTQFREAFKFPKDFKINWYPGHMAKTYRLLPNNIKKVDVFLEVRDCRIPISSGNSELNQLIPPHVKRIILFNKYDLCDQVYLCNIVEKN